MKIRYKLSTTGILILFLISFFSFFLGAVNQRKLRITKDAEQYFGYAYSEEISYFDEEGEGKLDFHALKTEKGNVFLNSVQVLRNDDKSSCVAEIICSVNEKIKYPLYTGKYEDDGTDNIILLGRSLKKHTYEAEGCDYLDVEGEAYRVVGYLGYRNTELYDYKMVFYADRMGDKLKDKIYDSCKQNFMFTIQSDKYDVDEIMEELNAKEALQNKLSGSEGMVIDGRATTIMQENVYYLIVWLVCILNAVLVSELWIAERMKEIRIRAAVGFSRLQILCRLYGELVSETAAFGGIIFIVYLIIQCMVETPAFSDVMFAFLVLLASSVLFSAMVMAYPIHKLNKSNVVKIR